MSTLKINTLSNGGSAIDFPNSFNIGGNAIEQGYTSSGTEPSSPATGDIWWDSTNEKLYQYLNSEFKEITIAAPAIWYGDRGIFAGFSNSDDTINYIDITTTGNATDFGNLSAVGHKTAACSNGTRALFSTTGAVSTPTNTIEYITTATTGNTTDFGDLSVARFYAASMSDGTYGVVAGGFTNSSASDTIDYVTIATTGNATDFGNLTGGTYQVSGCSDATRGIIAGGAGLGNTIEYITIATTGDASDFGDLLFAVQAHAGTSDATRGIFAGGYAPSQSPTNVKTIQYITIATTGNAADFGDLTVSSRSMSACSNGTRAVIHCGLNTNRMDYITIQTLGNAADFGDTTVSGQYMSGTSGSAS